MNKQEFLKSITSLAVSYEDPTGTNCTSIIGIEIDFVSDSERYSYDGEKFVQIDFNKKEQR